MGSYNWEAAAAQIGLAEIDFKRMVEIFVRETEADLKKLQQACDLGDSGETALTAHHIKGAALNLEFDQLAQAAKNLENEARQGKLESAARFRAIIEAELAEIRDSLSLKYRSK
jgi:HPt (histidine-containing phosphotransfer) domain-containing protein